MDALSPTRRTFLGFSLAAGIAAAAVPLLSSSASAAEGDSYEVLRGRWAEILTGGALVDPADPAFALPLAAVGLTAATALATMRPDPVAKTLWPGAVLTASANVTAGYKQLAAMATAYATPGAKAPDGRVLTGDAALASAVVAGLEFLHAQVYNAGQAEYGNWWDWEIGVPRPLLACLVLVPGVPEAQKSLYLGAIDHFVPDPRFNKPVREPSTGANRIDLCQVVAVRGVVGGSPSHIRLAVDGLSETFPYVASGDGFYADGSFMQHTYIPYTGTYGMVLLRGLGDLFRLFTGTDFAVSDPAVANIRNSVTDSFAPFVWRGQCLDSVRGRAIARIGESDVYDGVLITQAVLQEAASAPGALGEKHRKLAKGWIDALAAYAPFEKTATVPGIALAKSVSSVEGSEEPVGHRQFPAMDRVVHRAGDWAFALSLSSVRTARFEAMNGENLRGWHTGDGMAYLYLAGDPLHYNDGFWPTVDPRRLPGTTVDSVVLKDGAGTGTRPTAAWVGGSVLDRVGAVGMEFQQFGSTLRAFKSWFMLDDCVVALGAGISGGTADVVTTVENRNVRGGSRIYLDARKQPSEAGWSVADSAPQWAHVEGVGGYVFPSGGSLTVARTDRTGSWKDINTGGPADVLSRRYVSLTLSHGVKPVGASYAYLTLPGAEVFETAQRAKYPTVKVVSNTAAVQAITWKGLTAANFFAPGSAGGVTVDAPCSVIVRGTQIAVSDPTQRGGVVRVTAAGRTAEVDLTGAAGATRLI